MRSAAAAFGDPVHASGCDSTSPKMTTAIPAPRDSKARSRGYGPLKIAAVTGTPGNKGSQLHSDNGEAVGRDSVTNLPPRN
jgi:hypothetical protein